MTTSTDIPETDFGFRRVPLEDKPGLVRDLFAGVSDRYDLMNDLMSFRAHRLWKDAMVDWLAPRAGMRFLDLAGGTGDIAARIVDRTRGHAEVSVCDLTEVMLQRGRDRRGLRRRPVHWVCGDGAKLPFADGSFDACTIAFGLRNTADPERVLSEIFRTLRPGGRMLCLEFSQPHPPLVAAIYNRWSMAVIPRLGAAVASDRDAYQYLVESIRKFPDAQHLAEMMTGAGFDRVDWRPLAFGVAALHSGWRL